MNFVYGLEPMRKLASIIGLDPDIHPIKRIELQLNLDDVARVVVTRLVTADEMAAVEEMAETTPFFVVEQ